MTGQGAGPQGPRPPDGREARKDHGDGAGRHVTQLYVARAAGVSRSVVSHVLNRNGRISEQTRAKVLRIAQEMDYQPHAAASELASQRSRRIVVILPGTRLEPEEIERLGRSLPVCLLDRGLSDSPVRTVRMDESQAAEQIVSHLREQGHRHLAFLTPTAPMHEHLAAERAGACLREARRQGMSAQEIRCTGGALLALEAALEGRRRPVAVVAYNDLLAINIVAAAHHLGQRVGPDLAVASYDNTRLASRPEFDLTSVDQRPERLARAAVELLTSEEAQGSGRAGRAPATRTVRPYLAVRSSTKRPPKPLS